MSLKKTVLFDLNLYKNSSELLRQELGGFYKVASLEGDNSRVTFSEASSTDNEKIYNRYQSSTDLTTRNQTGFLPYVQYPVRVTANEDLLVSDEEWRAYLIGGLFGDKEYSGIYNTNIYTDHALDTEYFPFSPSEVVGSREGLLPSIVLTTEYFQNYARFQNYVAGLDSELSIPNYYFLRDRLFKVLKSRKNYPEYQYPLIQKYLNNAFINEPIEDPTNKKNIFVLRPSLISRKNDILRKTNSNYLKTEDDLSKIYSLMPFANKLEIGDSLCNFNSGKGVLEDNYFKNIVMEKGFEYKFISILKEAFQGEVSLVPELLQFGTATEGRSVNYETNIATITEEVSDVSLKTLDVPTMLLYSYENYQQQTDDTSVVNAAFFEEQVRLFSGNSGVYRHIANDKSLDVLNAFREQIDLNFPTEAVQSLDDFLNLANKEKYHETMAFRIQKIGGPPTGDDRTENTIQNIWFFNPLTAIKYIDTQVKYNTDYTYKIFSYVLIQGYKYQISDLVATKQIAKDTPGVRFPVVNYCLEFYDPFTGQTSEQLFSKQNLKSAGTNVLATNAQITSRSRYLADFKITIEPSVKIVEIPIEEKRMRIVDNPPNDFNVSPHHLQDQSNRLAFYLKYDTFSPNTEPYPATITTDDESNASSYKEGKDFVPGSLTKEESVSAPRFVQVFRMSQKPTSYKDFDGNLRATVDLSNQAGDVSPDHFFIEHVKENIKYYYMFRALNENGVAGQPSPIFESELINDGGYVYGSFNQLSESELIEPSPKTPLLSFKKLLNVVPNIQHLELNTQEVDFSKNSVGQIGNVVLGNSNIEEPLWNQKFKIRLTSKKTGRKVDLNLTFERKKK